MVLQLVVALRYKSEGRRVRSPMVSLEFFIEILQAAYGLGFDSASNRNECQRGKSGRCVGLTTLPPSCADCLEIWEPQPPGTLRACNGSALLLLIYQLLLFN